MKKLLKEIFKTCFEGRELGSNPYRFRVSIPLEMVVLSQQFATGFTTARLQKCSTCRMHTVVLWKTAHGSVQKRLTRHG